MKTLKLIANDPWLKPFENNINARFNYATQKRNELTNNGKISLSEFASGHHWFGMHRTENEWIFREWAPNVTQIFLIGEFNNWREEGMYALRPMPNGVWEICLPIHKLTHGSFINYRCIGLVDKVSAFLLGQTEWCKTNIQRFFAVRSGIPKQNTPLRLPISFLRPHHFLYTNATSAWHNQKIK
jgi:hypothetical protein